MCLSLVASNGVLLPDTPRQTRNAEVNFRGQKRSNAPHESVTDPNARLYKKSPGEGAGPQQHHAKRAE